MTIKKEKKYLRAELCSQSALRGWEDEEEMIAKELPVRQKQNLENMVSQK